MHIDDRVLAPGEVAELPTGVVIQVLWHGFKTAIWTYRVENICGHVYCTKVKVDGRWRCTQAPLPLKDVVTTRCSERAGTIVIGPPPS